MSHIEIAGLIFDLYHITLELMNLFTEHEALIKIILERILAHFK